MRLRHHPQWTAEHRLLTAGNRKEVRSTSCVGRRANRPAVSCACGVVRTRGCAWCSGRSQYVGVARQLVPIVGRTAIRINDARFCAYAEADARVHEKVVRGAKRCAAARGPSVSRLVERNLDLREPAPCRGLVRVRLQPTMRLRRQRLGGRYWLSCRRWAFADTPRESRRERR